MSETETILSDHINGILSRLAWKIILKPEGQAAVFLGRLRVQEWISDPSLYPRASWMLASVT